MPRPMVVTIWYTTHWPTVLVGESVVSSPDLTVARRLLTIA